MKIQGFSNYYLNDSFEVLKLDGTRITKQQTTRNTKAYKMKKDNGSWTTIAENKILSLAGIILGLPSDAIKIHNYNDYYIDRSGTLYSFSSKYPSGKILNKSIGKNGYLTVSLGAKNTQDVHKLMIQSFIMKDYIEKGLVCMHKDNNKLNCHIDNLCVGTYSKNNKDAYKDKLNAGNILGKNISSATKKSN